MPQEIIDKVPSLPFGELVMDFHIWSQSVYPGEFSYFPSLGKEFKAIELEFDHDRTRVLSLLKGLAEGFFTHPRQTIQYNLEDLEIRERHLHSVNVQNSDIEVYQGYIYMTRRLLNKALTVLLKHYPDTL
jgi:hypothetical protein